MSARVELLTVRADPDAWRSIGLVVSDDGVVALMGTSIRVVALTPGTSDELAGITGWTLSGVEASLHGSAIDGLPTEVADPSVPMFAGHGLGASGIDHVVVMTHDLLRTSGAIAAATGCELKRVREVGTMKQGFHRIGRGGLIVEIVERPEVEEGPARFWGLVINVDDIDAACAHLADGLVSEPRDAVQPGRRIATISAEAGLGLPVALMTP